MADISIEWFRKELGARIKNLRKQHKYSQEQFGQLLNLSRVSVMNIEAGRHCPPLLTIYAICCIFKCQVAELMPPVKFINVKSKNRIIVKKTTRKIMKPII